MLSDAKARAAKPRHKPYKLTDSNQLFRNLCAGGCTALKRIVFISFRSRLTYISAALVRAVPAFMPGLRECSWWV